METEPLSKYHDTDVQPTVDPIYVEAPILGTPTELHFAPTRQALRDDFDLHNPELEQPRLTHRALQSVKDFLKHAKDLICSERINVLLVFLPVGVTIGFLDVDLILVFILNALAIIPLAVVISTATESIASRLGDTLGALLNVTVGNTAELMIFFMALAKNQIRIVQASLLGSVLANLLLVLGTAFLAGGLRFANQLDDRPAAHLSLGLLDFGLLISMFPIAFLVASNHATTSDIKPEVLAISRGTSIGLICVYLMYLVIQMREPPPIHSRYDEDTSMHSASALPLSSLRPSTRRLGLKWISALGNSHELRQHRNASQVDGAASGLLRRTTSLGDFDVAIHDDRNSNNAVGRRSRSVGAKPNHGYHTPNDSIEYHNRRDSLYSNGERNSADMGLNRGQDDRVLTTRSLHAGLPPSPPSTPGSDASHTSRHRTSLAMQDQVDLSRFTDPENLYRPGALRLHKRQNTLAELYAYRNHRTKQSKTPLSVAINALIVATGFVSICTEHAVDAIPSIVESWGVSQIFLGFIVLPVVGNAAEHIIAAKLAMNNKMVLAKKVAVESSAQIVLLIMPAVVLIGWVKQLEMSMRFDIFEIASIVMTSVVASVLVSRGKGDWKQGLLLHTIFLIVSLGALIYPTTTKLYGQ